MPMQLIQLLTILSLLAWPGLTAAQPDIASSNLEKADSFEELIGEVKDRFGSEIISEITSDFDEQFLRQLFYEQPGRLRDYLIETRDRRALQLALDRDTVAPAPQALPDRIAASRPAVAKVITRDVAGNEVSSGTAFQIGNDMLLTSRHVLRGAALVELRFADGREFNVARLLVSGGIDPLDVAVLVIDGTLGSSPLQLCQTEPQTGDRVLVMGNPLGLEITASDGIISGVQDDGQFLQITAPISAGSSGSPVLDERLQVLGIVTATMPSGQAINLAVPSPAVRAVDYWTAVSFDHLNERFAVELYLDGGRIMRGIALRNGGRPGLLLPSEDAMPIDELRTLAENRFREAIALDADDADFWDALAECLFEQARFSDELECLQECISLEPVPPSPDDERYAPYGDSGPSLYLRDVRTIADRYKRLANSLVLAQFLEQGIESGKNADFAAAESACRQALHLLESVSTEGCQEGTDILIAVDRHQVLVLLSAILREVNRPGEKFLQDARQDHARGIFLEELTLLKSFRPLPILRIGLSEQKARRGIARF